MSAAAQRIDVRRDHDGVRAAALSLYEQSFRADEMRQVIAGSEPEEVAEIVLKLGGERTLAAGYFLWAAYLMWLRPVIALPGAGLDLLADEAEGLLAVERAEMEFRRSHPACFQCGALNEAFAMCCRKCSTEFKGS